MKQYYLSIVLLFFISFLFGQDAASIISKTEINYATMNTYLDSGKAESVFYHSPNPPHSTTVLFKTAYSQNGVLNYEFYEPGKLNSLHIINRDINNKVQKWDGVSNLIKVDTSLSIPLASAAATSYTASVLITNLLMPDNKILSVFNVFKSLSDLKLASEIVNGNPCYKITGIKNQKQEQSSTIWVSEKDFLILKVEENYGDNNDRVKNTLQFFPCTLKTLDKDLFAFNPNHQIPVSAAASKRIPFTDTNKVVYDEKGNALRYYQYSKMLESGEYTIGTGGDPYLPDTKFYLEKTSSLMLRMRENQATNAVRSQRTDVVSGNILKENNTLDLY